MFRLILAVSSGAIPCPLPPVTISFDSRCFSNLDTASVSQNAVESSLFLPSVFAQPPIAAIVARCVSPPLDSPFCSN